MVFVSCYCVIPSTDAHDMATLDELAARLDETSKLLKETQRSLQQLRVLTLAAVGVLTAIVVQFNCGQLSPADSRLTDSGLFVGDWFLSQSATGLLQFTYTATQTVALSVSPAQVMTTSQIRLGPNAEWLLSSYQNALTVTGQQRQAVMFRGDGTVACAQLNVTAGIGVGPKSLQDIIRQVAPQAQNQVGAPHGKRMSSVFFPGTEGELCFRARHWRALRRGWVGFRSLTLVCREQYYCIQVGVTFITALLCR